jgi:hypothetical protein
MATKSARFVLALGVSVGIGITLFNIAGDPGTYVTPSGEQRPPTPLPRSPLKQEQQAAPRSELSTRHSSSAGAETGKAAPAPQPPRRSDLFVEVRHGEVTLQAENQSLKKVLEALAHESGVQINSQLIGDRPLSITLVRVPLDRALQTILEFEDSFFAFASHGQAPVTVEAVWVVPAGTGGTWPPQTAGCLRDLASLELQLASAHSHQRAEAVETLIDLRGPEAAQTVVRSLADRDDNVRYRILQKAHGAGLVLPPEVLENLVRHDRSELVRMLAIDAIGNHPSMDARDKMTFARSAVNDSSPAVQTRASELFSHLESAALLREQDDWAYEEAHEGQTGGLEDESTGAPAE